MNWRPRACAIGRALGAAVWLIALAVGLVLVVVLAPGCGTAGQVSTGAACSSLMQVIASREDYAPERAHADIDSVAAVCHRLEAVDGGAP